MGAGKNEEQQAQDMSGAHSTLEQTGSQAVLHNITYSKQNVGDGPFVPRL